MKSIYGSSQRSSGSKLYSYHPCYLSYNPILQTLRLARLTEAVHEGAVRTLAGKCSFDEVLSHQFRAPRPILFLLSVLIFNSCTDSFLICCVCILLYVFWIILTVASHCYFVYGHLKYSTTCVTQVACMHTPHSTPRVT